MNCKGHLAVKSTWDSDKKDDAAFMDYEEMYRGLFY